MHSGLQTMISTQMFKDALGLKMMISTQMFKDALGLTHDGQYSNVYRCTPAYK